MAEIFDFGKTKAKSKKAFLLPIRRRKAFSFFLKKPSPKTQFSAVQSFWDSKTLFSKRVLVGVQGAKPPAPRVLKTPPSRGLGKGR
jgi:hypothetical protein